MNTDVEFQGNSETMQVQMTEEDTTFQSSYGESMTLMGPSGKSAYQVAVDNGFKGSEAQWLASLKGADGKNGTNGYTPKKGIDYFTEIEKAEFADEVISEAFPKVSKEDDGKILQVDDGVWTKKHLPPCDTELSQMSVNAVQNKAIATKFAEVETTIGNIDVLLGTI